MPAPGFAAIVSALERARSFDGACALVVEHLEAGAPMGMWAVTRVVGNTQTMLTVTAPEYEMQVGDELPFPTSLCVQMTSLQGPIVNPDISSIPGYVAAARSTALHNLPVAAYAGVPIFGPGDELFGTLCGYSARPVPALGEDLESLLVLLAALLAALLHADRSLTEAAREVERARSLADVDELTGLLNRRGWNRFLELEEARYRRFGDPAGIVVLDLDHLKQINDIRGHHEGDGILRATAEILRRSTRDADVVARLGGDEFGVITTGVDSDHTAALIGRLRQTFDQAGVSVSIGFGRHTVAGGFHRAWKDADRMMYEDKHRRRPADR